LRDNEQSTKVQEKGLAVPTFERWIGYLQDRQLVVVEGGNYRLTPLGVDFIALYAPAIPLGPSDRGF
jgi:hypothetical protein